MAVQIFVRLKQGTCVQGNPQSVVLFVVMGSLLDLRLVMIRIQKVWMDVMKLVRLKKDSL